MLIQSKASKLFLWKQAWFPLQLQFLVRTLGLHLQPEASLLSVVRKPLESLPVAAHLLVAVRSPRRVRSPEHAAAGQGPGGDKTCSPLGRPGGGAPGRRAALLSRDRPRSLPKPLAAASAWLLPVETFG